MKYWIITIIALAGFALAGCGTEMNLKGIQAAGVGTATPFGAGTGTPDGKVGICHRTDSAANPWVYIIVDANAIPAHQQHGDVFGLLSQTDCDALVLTGTPPPLTTIPTATPIFTATPTQTTFSGTATPTPFGVTNTPQAQTNGKVGICHHTGSAKNPYVYIVVSQNAVPAHMKHGDIIGVSSAAACPAKAIDSDKNNNGKNDDKDKGNGKGNGKNKDKGNKHKGNKD